MLLQGFGLDPISSLSYMAPVVLAANAVILLPVEGFGVFADAIEKVGVPYLLFKCVSSSSPPTSSLLRALTFFLCVYETVPR